MTQQSKLAKQLKINPRTFNWRTDWFMRRAPRKLTLGDLVALFAGGILIGVCLHGILDSITHIGLTFGGLR